MALDWVVLPSCMRRFVERSQAFVSNHLADATESNLFQEEQDFA